MALTLITAHRELELGAAPRTGRACFSCGAPAQVATQQLAACAPCTVSALNLMHAHLDKARG